MVQSGHFVRCGPALLSIGEITVQCVFLCSAFYEQFSVAICKMAVDVHGEVKGFSLDNLWWRLPTVHSGLHGILSRSGQYLLSGDTGGVVYVWDVNTAPPDGGEGVLQPHLQFQAHGDCTNGIRYSIETLAVMGSMGPKAHLHMGISTDVAPIFVFFFSPFCLSIHPYMPLLVSSCGQRQFSCPGESEGDSGSESDAAASPISSADNALTLWWAGPPGSAGDRNQEAQPE